MSDQKKKNEVQERIDQHRRQEGGRSSNTFIREDSQRIDRNSVTSRESDRRSQPSRDKDSDDD